MKAFYFFIQRKSSLKVGADNSCKALQGNLGIKVRVGNEKLHIL